MDFPYIFFPWPKALSLKSARRFMSIWLDVIRLSIFRGHDFPQELVTNSNHRMASKWIDISGGGTFLLFFNVIFFPAKSHQRKLCNCPMITGCSCSPYGSVRPDCEKSGGDSGQCVCKPGILGQNCDLCPDGSTVTETGCPKCKRTPYFNHSNLNTSI